MLADHLRHIREKSNCAENFFAKVIGGENASLNVPSTARPLFMSLIWRYLDKGCFVITAGEDNAHKLTRQISNFVGIDNVIEMPDYNCRYTDDIPIDPQIAARRALCLQSLLSGENKIIVASARAVMRLAPDPVEKMQEPLLLRSGEELEDIEELFDSLQILGYERVKRARERGEFSFKGGVVDIFAGNSEMPIRLDMFGDEIESIKKVFASTGQTLQDVDEAIIYPVTELPLSPKRLTKAKEALSKKAKSNKQIRELLEKLEDGLDLKSQHLLLPYLTDKMCNISQLINSNFAVCFDEPSAIAMDSSRQLQNFEVELDKTSAKTSQLIADLSNINFNKWQNISLTSISRRGLEVDDTVKVLRTGLSSSEVEMVDKVREWIDARHFIVCGTSKANNRVSFQADFLDAGIATNGLESSEKPKLEAVNLTNSDFSLGFVIPALRLALFGDNDLSGQIQNFRRRNSLDITKITFPYEVGDYVVHSRFGIAKFSCIIKRKDDNIERDYLVLEYAENDKLYLPIEQFDRITKYVGEAGPNPKLTRLKTKDWSKAVSKARAATRRLAFDLVDVYSRRANVNGFAFEIDENVRDMLSATFEFEETPDQRIAIDEVYTDMSSTRVMDRLICGDVGFGKTEVALRACYIAKCNQKQTMLLCPTTILAQQHFETFFERLDALSVSVDVISRFRTAKQQKETLEKFARGELDVLIGTHRLLSRDVNPKNLGLVIVDEEQRFGVGHKEQFKNLRETIDVLTLSATPIPRTLQMSLSGVRDMSLIMTPPKDRHAVEVFVGPWDRDVVQTALRRELARGGQVYYVSNRVNTIEFVEERICELVPEARIGIVHGQMSKTELEAVMEDFSARKLDILIATSIVESGIDNPHTNTLIIEDSHRLGLAQMYQLKGRVGRSKVQAYAYFMFPDDMPLTNEAQSRLLALDEHQELGSGLRIALRDLEIRGAGEMFGAEQSGNLSAVGFDLFAAMLNEAIVNERTGEKEASGAPAALSDIVLNLSVNAYISDEYIEDVNDRVLIYRRLACATSDELIDDIFAEMINMYPEPPEETLNVFARARLRSFCNDNGINTISVAKGYLEVEPIEIDTKKLEDLRSLAARYSAKQKHLKVPVRNVGIELDVFGGIQNFLTSLL